MKAYIISIVGAALLSAFADMMLPAGWRKYVRMITGLLLLSVMLAPVAKLQDIDIPEAMQLEETAVDAAGQDVHAEVIQELELRIAADAAQRIQEEYGIAAKVRAVVKANAENQIEYVELLEITAQSLPDGVRARMQEVYDVREVSIHG